MATWVDVVDYEIARPDVLAQVSLQQFVKTLSLIW